MRLKFCLLFLCILAAALVVQSETTIEVDENGDEYEVKRFNIEGRQLNGGRSQCVVSRRKRSTAPANDEEANDNKNGNSNRVQNDGATTTNTTPASGVDTNTNGEDGGDYDENDGEGNEEINHHVSHNGGNYEGDEDADPEDGDKYDYDEDEEQNNQGNARPSINAHKQGENAEAAENHENGEHAENGNGVVVVQSNVKPQVNPDTHAVFQLLPVNHALNAAIDYDADNGVLHFEEDISPVSTTAIWSTGDDVPQDSDYADYDYVVADNSDGKKKKKIKKPSSSSSSGNKDKKNKKKKHSKSGLKKKGNKNKVQKNKNKKKKKPTNSSMNKNRRPGNKNKKPIAGNRRKPQRNQSNTNSIRTRKNNNSNSNRNSNRRSSANRNNRNSNRRRKNNLDVVDKGTRTYTKTETMTQTGTADDEKDVNCIIIRKDPPPTERPFWNILGRNAEDSTNSGRSSHFGNRKRANLRFASQKQN